MIDLFAKRARQLQAEVQTAREQARWALTEVEILRRELAAARADARQAWQIAEALGDLAPLTMARATLTVLGKSATG